MKKQKGICHHEFDEKTTLIISPKLFAVYPGIYDCFCKCCNKAFKFTKQDGKFVLIDTK